MEAAMAFGFDQQNAPAGRNLGAKARSGDPAADNQDVHVAHLLNVVTVLKAASSTCAK
jgi:hypothetical protein